MSAIQASELKDKNGKVIRFVDEEARKTAAENGQKVDQLTEEKLDKQQGADNAGKLLSVAPDGRVMHISTGEGLASVVGAGKNIFYGEWIPGKFNANTDGLWVDGPENGSNIGVNERFRVTPGATYTVSTTELVTGTTMWASYVLQYDADGAYISSINYVWDASRVLSAKFTVSDNTHYISFYVYAKGSTSCYDYVPANMMIEKGNVATEYEPYNPANNVIAVDVFAVHSKMVKEGLLSEKTIVPTYYLNADYLPNKCIRIRELLEGCAGNGDVFMFVTDQHWPLNAQKSPVLMKYISEKVHIPWVFSGGDTADYASEEYAQALDDAFGGSIHHTMGNHDWFGDIDGNELAYIFDMGKREQVGNAIRHYYYVDNPQQSIRYIVLNAFSNESGELGSAYDAEQVAWLRDVALDVDNAWTVVVITHCLYSGEYTSPSLYLTPDGADSIVAVIDAAECEVACVIQGHTHLDRIIHTPGGIPVVVTTCDKYYPWIKSDVDMEPWLSNRVEGTITEQAFDVVVLDKANRQLTFVRIGAPADNWTDGTSTGTVEERVVTY